MDITVYNPVPETTKNSKIYEKFTATIKGSYLLHDDGHTAVLINKIEEIGLRVQ